VWVETEMFSVYEWVSVRCVCVDGGGFSVGPCPSVVEARVGEGACAGDSWCGREMNAGAQLGVATEGWDGWNWGCGVLGELEDCFVCHVDCVLLKE